MVQFDREKALNGMKPVICSAVCLIAGDADPPQQKGAWDGAWIHGNTSAFVAAPPLSKYSKLLIPRRPFLSSSTLFVPSHFIEAGGRRLLSEPLSKQWRKEPAIFTLFPGELAFYYFLFELQAVELSRQFDVRKLN